ncbi:hypothetical protein vseg_012350 [Gypsophila vaccaria]
MNNENKMHFVLATMPSQSLINPALEFAKRLLKAGAHVTFFTSLHGKQFLGKADVPEGLVVSAFPDGMADGSNKGLDFATLMSKFRERGSKSLGALLEESRAEGKQVTCLVQSSLSWAAKVAREYHVPSALLWIQPAAVFDLYYYYFRGYGDVIKECETDPLWSLKLPNMSFTLKECDLPSFLLPSTPHPFILDMFLEQIEELEKEERPTVLVNTFEALEVDALKAIERFTLIPIGPLLPSKLFEAGDVVDKSCDRDLKDEDYIKWLDSQEKSEVIYVSFGSICVLSRAQQEEMARALVKINRPFLWVIREKQKKDNEGGQNENTDEAELIGMEELKQLGRIVPWCAQVEVLSHPSVGCFVTHCGWNSTLESITCGVPMVAFPQWTDQTTNAKLVEDVWKIGVRVKKSEDDEGLVKDEEIIRCLVEVMENKEIRINVNKWKEVVVQATTIQGSDSDKNLKRFIEDITSHQ